MWLSWFFEAKAGTFGSTRPKMRDLFAYFEVQDSSS